MADHHQRVILHVDLDCFYAQVEHLRLGVPLTQPLAVQQWNNLIAVNYAARAFGVRRHASIQEALGLCPQLRLVHVPTYALQPSTKGTATNTDTDMDTEAFVVDGMAVQPRYHDEEVASFGADGRRMAPAAPDPAAHKACLDPYRQASRAIFALLRAWQPGGAVPVVEKGGLDEAFLDVTEAVEELLVEEYAERYAMLREEVAEQDVTSVSESVSAGGTSAGARGTSYSESSGSKVTSESGASSGPSESHTPHTPHTSHTSALALYDLTWIETGLCWEGRGGFVLPDAPESSALPLLERSRHALATLRLWRGAALAAQLRQHLRAQLGFQASVGIACNKMLAKLASAMYKPDQQTTVLPGHVRAFMQRVPFDRIRLLGGKLGRRVLHARVRDQGEDADEPDGPEDSDEEPAAPGVVHAADLWPLSVEALAERIHGMLFWLMGDLAAALNEAVRLVLALERRLGDLLFKDFLALHFSQTRPPTEGVDDHAVVMLLAEQIEAARDRGELDPSVNAVNSSVFFLLGFYALLITTNDWPNRDELLADYVGRTLRSMAPQ